jgi:hypothetical protein
LDFDLLKIKSKSRYVVWIEVYWTQGRHDGGAKVNA